MLICATCGSIVGPDGKCTNPRCGTGNHVKWPGKPTRKEMPEIARERLREQVQIAKQIDRSCRFILLEVLDDGYTMCRCSGCGAEWDWIDPKLVRYCPECGRPVEHDE